MRKLTLEEFDQWVEGSTWIWAKTYARKAPHWYCLRAHQQDMELFDSVALFIREQGQDGWFWRKKMRYFFRGAYKYWTMSAPVEETILVNRALVDGGGPAPDESEKET